MKEEEPPIPEWIPVGKRKPRTHYCYVINKSINPDCFVAKYDKIADQFLLKDYRISIAIKVTHFVELPEFWEAFES